MQRCLEFSFRFLNPVSDNIKYIRYRIFFIDFVVIQVSKYSLDFRKILFQHDNAGIFIHFIEFFLLKTWTKVKSLSQFLAKLFNFYITFWNCFISAFGLDDCPFRINPVLERRPSISRFFQRRKKVFVELWFFDCVSNIYNDQL